MSKEFLPHEHFLKLLYLNAMNKNLSDTQFRHFVKDTLGIVQGFTQAKEELEEDGRIPKEEKKVEDRTSGYNYQDQPGESQAEYFGKV